MAYPVAGTGALVATVGNDARALSALSDEELTDHVLTDPRGITELSLALRAVRQTPKPSSSESTGTADTAGS